MSHNPQQTYHKSDGREAEGKGGKGGKGGKRGKGGGGDVTRSCMPIQVVLAPNGLLAV